MKKVTVSNKELLEKIQLSIKNKTPLSYIRIGDGEIQLLKLPKHCQIDMESEIRESALTSVFRRYNQTYTPTAHLDSSFLKKWQKIVIDAINTSDYLGIFSYQEIIELRGAGFLEMDDRYVPNKFVLEHYNFDFDKLKTCSPLFNRFPALGIIENFKKLIGNERITIMTDMTEELKVNKKFKKYLGDQVDFISVKHTHATATDKTFYQRDYLRSHFKDIKSHVVLYCLGGAGKDLCNELKNDWGKCVIDMGSVMDAWAGSISRPSYLEGWSHCVSVPLSEAPHKMTGIL